MRTIPYLPLLSLSVLMLATPISVRAADMDADNSGKNSGDVANSTDTQKNKMTPEEQSNKSEDVKVTRMIRRAVVKDSSLSMYAHNIKIITTQDHVVYLRGPVATMDEAKMILKMATKNSGGYPVKNELSVSK